MRPARASSLRLRIVNPNTVTVTVTVTVSPTPTRIPTPALTLTLTRPAWRSWRACARPTCATTLRTPCSGSGASWPIFRASSGKESGRARAPLACEVRLGCWRRACFARRAARRLSFVCVIRRVLPCVCLSHVFIISECTTSVNKQPFPPPCGWINTLGRSLLSPYSFELTYFTAPRPSQPPYPFTHVLTLLSLAEQEIQILVPVRHDPLESALQL